MADDFEDTMEVAFQSRAISFAEAWHIITAQGPTSRVPRSSVQHLDQQEAERAERSGYLPVRVAVVSAAPEKWVQVLLSELHLFHSGSVLLLQYTEAGVIAFSSDVLRRLRRKNMATAMMERKITPPTTSTALALAEFLDLGGDDEEVMELRGVFLPPPVMVVLKGIIDTNTVTALIWPTGSNVVVGCPTQEEP
uniref:Uncharacterized protein n=1 Tax=Moniliophthora roreri TaxID=221103 RepID=A0A0W0F7Y4_MONRR